MEGGKLEKNPQIMGETYYSNPYSHMSYELEKNYYELTIMTVYAYNTSSI